MDQKTRSIRRTGKQSPQDFEIGRIIGRGTWNQVRVAKAKNDAVWALKIFKKTDIIKNKQAERILIERNLLANLAHPFIVSFSTAFDDKKFVYYVYEFVSGGEFQKQVTSKGPLGETQVKFYSAQIIEVFTYMHTYDSIFRDLRPENLLLGQSGYIKLISFGLAKRVEYKTYTICGTPEYLAPEMLSYTGYSREVDWWTLGIFMYELLVGATPFYHENQFQIYNNILNNNINYPDVISQNMRLLLEHLLETNASERYGCRVGYGTQDILNHPIYTSFDWNGLKNMTLSAPFKPNKDDSKLGASNYSNYPDDSLSGAEEPRFNELFKDPFVDMF